MWRSAWCESPASTLEDFGFYPRKNDGEIEKSSNIRQPKKKQGTRLKSGQIIINSRVLRLNFVLGYKLLFGFKRSLRLVSRAKMQAANLFKQNTVDLLSPISLEISLRVKGATSMQTFNHHSNHGFKDVELPMVCWSCYPKCWAWVPVWTMNSWRTQKSWRWTVDMIFRISIG